jgi:C4-dicarboxylate transporter DctM subunit
LLILSLVLLIVLFVLGVPIGFSMLVSSSVFLHSERFDMLVIPQYMYDGINMFSLLAVPGFIFLGELMSRCGMTERLTGLAMSIIGHIRGGLGHVTVMAGMLMAGISGSAVADSAALGSVLVPFMKKNGYPPEFAAIVVATAGTLGPIIPPSIGMVILGSMANISVGRLFLGGAIPGILMGLYSMIAIYIIARKRDYGRMAIKFSLKGILRTVIDSSLALFIPILIIGGILMGVFTPTETSIVAVLFVLIVGVFVYRTLSLSAIFEALKTSVYSVGAIFFILAAARVIGWVLAIEQFDVLFGNTLRNITSNPTLVLFLISGSFIVLGCFVETLALLILFSPFLFPIVTGFGVDPIHFGIVFMLSLVIGLITPPVGLCMYVACTVSDVSIEAFTKELLPFFIALITVLIMAILFPSLSTWLPYLLMPGAG